jgi:hypothetical protein
MKHDDIESEARNLHRRIWSRRGELWPDRSELSVVEIVDPAIAARVLGIDFQLHPDLRWFTSPCAPLLDTAGILDRDGPTIFVSTKYLPRTQRFTAAHELGHFVLHDDIVLHRDMPIDGLAVEDRNLPPKERQANKFAAFFLMPRRRVVEAFEFSFGKIPFVFDDTAAFGLCGRDPDSILKPSSDSLARYRALASAGHYGGRHFVPLHEQFLVSPTSMAIRIRELGLVLE